MKKEQWRAALEKRWLCKVLFGKRVFKNWETIVILQEITTTEDKNNAAETPK